MTDDQRFASRRPDVLVYQTEVLAEDLTLVGPLTAALRVSTTGTDSDFVVKLIDVYSGDHPGVGPESGVAMGGYQQLVRGEPMRGVCVCVCLCVCVCRVVPSLPLTPHTS